MRPPVAAVAVFVKTAGLSPLKTRLARGVGEAAAHEFYALACAAVRSVVAAAAKSCAFPVQGVWAVAEAEALSRWRGDGFEAAAQGEGELGARLDKVYDELVRAHGEAWLIGADAPQISVDDLVAARHALDGGATFVLAPARDGGFWLMGGRRPVPRATWESVPYSDARTFACMQAALAPLGDVATLALKADVDEAEDLATLAAELAALPRRTPEQERLAAWLSDRASARSP